MIHRIHKHLPILISLLLLLAAAWVKLDQSPFMITLQNQVFDVYQRYFPRLYQDAGVKIIDIDDESLSRLGQWPWPRSLIATMIDKLVAAQAGVVAFDVVFAEPDRTSPSNSAAFWHVDAGLKKQLLALPDHDTKLAQAFATGYVVTGFALTNDINTRQPTKKSGLSFAGNPDSNPIDFLNGNFEGATTNLAALEQSAEGNGFFNNTPDADGMVRRVPLMLALKDQIYPSLAMESLRVVQGASSYIIKMAGASGEQSFGAETGITQIRNGKFDIPTDSSGNFLVHYTKQVPSRYIPAWKLFEPDFDKTLVQGQMLFVGTSAAGLKDLRATPLNPALPGVEVHVQMLEQILLGQFLFRPDWMLIAETLGMIGCGLVLMAVMARLTAVWGAVFMMAAQGAALWFSVEMFRTQGFLIDPISPGLVILCLYLTESLRRYMLSERERKQVRGAFSQYMSPDLVKELAKHPEKLTLGGEIRPMTVLFCDIRGFTTISERYNAQQLTTFINRFLTPMTDVIMARKGTIDKYMGDCIMAFWNAPLDDENHALNGCLSALEMFKELEKLNNDRKQRAIDEHWDYFPVAIGIGLNSGDICVGNMGSSQRFDYSVLGDDVNLASRLEGQSKNYGVNIVIGQNTQAQVPQLATLELDRIKVKGKLEAVTVYALLGDEALADSADFTRMKELWLKALKSYRAQHWDEAENFIRLCEGAAEKLTHASASEGIAAAKRSGEDNSLDHVVAGAPRISGLENINGLFALYRERLATYRITPPPADWDGVFEAKSK